MLVSNKVVSTASNWNSSTIYFLHASKTSVLRINQINAQIVVICAKHIHRIVHESFALLIMADSELRRMWFR